MFDGLEELRGRADAGDPSSCIALGDALLARAPYVAPRWEDDLHWQALSSNLAAAEFDANWAHDAGRFEGWRTSEQWVTSASLRRDRYQEDLGRSTPGRWEVLRAATEYFERAARTGDPAAMWRRGWRSWLGQGVPVDEAEAVRWWRDAAERGHPSAVDLLWRLDVIPYPG